MLWYKLEGVAVEIFIKSAESLALIFWVGLEEEPVMQSWLLKMYWIFERFLLSLMTHRVLTKLIKVTDKCHEKQPYFVKPNLES